MPKQLVGSSLIKQSPQQVNIKASFFCEPPADAKNGNFTTANELAR
jgi:hypothetical protein